jgi:hypothetical protein
MRAVLSDAHADLTPVTPGNSSLLRLDGRTPLTKAHPLLLVQKEEGKGREEHIVFVLCCTKLTVFLYN